MSVKKVSFGSKRPSQANNNNIDSWVEHRDADSAVLPPPPPQEPMKRLTIDVSVSLHKRIKSQCALQNLRMADAIRDLLEDHFSSHAAGEGASS